jgi:Putative zinc-finger
LTTDHPDHEQLAAFQAGDGDRRQRAEVEAHLAGCPSCAEVVASVERARGRLALLEEPDLPPGLHDRLAAAVEAEAARPAATRRRRERAVPWYRRPVAWGAAAVLLLAALVAVPLLDRSTERSTASGGGGSQAAQEAGSDTAAAGAGSLPVLRIPGEVSAAAIRARLATDFRARSALEGGAPVSPPGTRAAPDQPQQGADSTSQGLGSSAPTPQAGSASIPACLVAATAAADPALRPLNPAFFVEGTYKGRQATVLVTTSTAQPGRADLWVFPRNDCSAAPLATERVR